jgi:hypothetical protein
MTGELSFALVVMNTDGSHIRRHERGNGLWSRRRDGLPVFRTGQFAAYYDARGIPMFIVAVGEGAGNQNTHEMTV